MTSMTSITVTNFEGTYGIEGKGVRPVGWSRVSRKRVRGDGKARTTCSKVIDAGAVSTTYAHRTALGWARLDGAQIKTHTIDLGYLGDFADSDAGRDAYLAAVRSRMGR